MHFEELKLAKHVSIINWPSPQDYNEALQNPATCFADLELAGCVAESNEFGLPRPITGMFASVYRMVGNQNDWALRCFLHYVADQVERYAAIDAALSFHKLQNTVPFQMQERGIFVKGIWLPVLKMQWCQGETLDRWLASNVFDRGKLDEFLEQWKELLISFTAAGIAHGDLQHGNIIVSGDRIKVVDYDGMYVPELAGKQSNELGHRNYQHPSRAKYHYGPYLDNFSAWVISVSVEILREDPTLWIHLHGGEDCLLFCKDDFDDPLHSSTFHFLENRENGEVRRLSQTLRYLLSLDLEDIPDLNSKIILPESLPSLEGYRPYVRQEAQLIQEVPAPETVTAHSGKTMVRTRGAGGFRRMQPASLTLSRQVELASVGDDFLPVPIVLFITLIIWLCCCGLSAWVNF